ncbi:MAG: ATP-binding protein [Opitutaceae bacterium]|jgi:predicted AAA+ superfamily ATPase|nr:ATP-binding protein [Opitutaceae bacterium]
MKPRLIARPAYLEQLVNFRDTRLIKVISGIRRCGKSTLLDLFATYLQSSGVPSGNILRVNLEDPDFRELTTWERLYDHIAARLRKGTMNYVFIDEVQTVPEFQRAVDGLFVKKNCDVYVTGFNASLLSCELATRLSGRYVEIKMLPLSFREYVSAFDSRSDLALRYRDYLRNSSFPYTLELGRPQDIRAYLGAIYDSIILKDIVARKGIADVAQLDRLVRFLADNIGSLCSATKIANTLASAGWKLSVHTVDNYLSALTESFIFHKAGRYDVRGKQRLVTGAKYYLSDIGLRYFLLGGQNADMGHILENIVYLELLRRGDEVFVGKTVGGEIDFVTVGAKGEQYWQVAHTVADPQTLARELAPLDALRDHSPKYLLTMDAVPDVAHNGIRQAFVLDWLLD